MLRGHSRRRSVLKYLGFQSLRLHRTLFWVTGIPLTQVKTCLKFWGLPRKRIWYVRGLLWKLVNVDNFGCRDIPSPISSVCGCVRECRLFCWLLCWEGGLTRRGTQYDPIFPAQRRGGGLGSRPKKMYGKRLGDGVEYHLMSLREEAHNKTTQ